MSVDASPPVQPPQLSPDGKWVWDGAQWQPVVGVDSGRAAVFPSWNSIEVPAAQPAVDAVPLAVQYEPAAQYRPPAVDYSYAAADEPIVQLWNQPKKGGKTVFLYPVAGLAVLVMAMMVLNSVGYIAFPWKSAGSSNNATTQSAKASPTPDFSGPDSVRADRFLNKYLAPPLVALDKANTTQNLRCQGHRTSQCFDALTATSAQVKSVLSVIQTQDIPKCIASQMAVVLVYVQGMDTQLQVALAAFNDNSDDKLITGVYRFRTYYKLTTGSLDTVNQAKKYCHTVVLPTWVP